MLHLIYASVVNLAQNLTQLLTISERRTEDFTPGYGCLFSVEFINIEATKAFYENVQFHIGPHLGAHLTLVMPYTKGLYGKQ
jgi:cystathionine gamma-synthase